ncbi:unnamed protein product [Leptidea sinapis]|uniref:YiaAB two helix domain-containing protein n=1 Tax=Leptidea sinapis TaxID=189913 RepID=A0A5E4Q9T9_9NEOP|nr:unnamed protein product [Leptidea sinapis]
MFFLCCGPDQNRYVQLIKGIGYTMLASGISACIAVIVFACFGNTDGWMPDHANNYLACIVTGALFLTEANIQAKKRKRLKESQARFELEEESRA